MINRPCQPIGFTLLVIAFVMTGTACMAGGYKNISPTEARKMINSGQESLLILDVRTAGEYKKDKHIKNSVLIPISVIEARISEIEAYREKNVIVYCKVGGRSSRVSNYLTGQGFKKIHNMTGGIREWKRLGYEVE
ncbi:MAG: rhodanese-like domain-containing protein [Deltaproteobacteria bacterium]|nr:rhodanese-like domain-containing protein [Deltaproteobacteria bacterium]